MRNPFRYFKTSPEIIRLAVMMYVRFPLSLRQVEDLLHERGIDISYETVRTWWNRFGPMFAAEIRKTRVAAHRNWVQWRWHLDEVFVRINGETPNVKRRAAGSTTEPKTHTSPSGDESGRWQNSGAQDHYRNSPRSILQSTITSTENVIFATGKTSNSIAPPPW